MSETLAYYRNQVALARTEINNLRQQIAALKHKNQKDVTSITATLNDLRCMKCFEKATKILNENSSECGSSDENSLAESKSFNFKSIGFLETPFPNKRAVTRQASVLGQARGVVVIDANVLNNPHYALNGLEDYSHMWIIYYFHVIENKHVPAKVAPPRLLGEKLGIFATRCPNRPSRIGLSLVEIDRIEGNKVYFNGVDMVNGTPVLDIKPYIPQYDSPQPKHIQLTALEGQHGIAEALDYLQFEDNVSKSPSPGLINNLTDKNMSPLMLSDDETELHDIQQGNLATPISPSVGFPSSADFNEGTSNSSIRIPDTERGAPDGQERFTPPQSALTNISNDGIRVPPWISNPPTQRFDVRFTDDALIRLQDLIGDRAETFKSNIASLLSEDPRSHYVRSRYPDHEYSCVFEDVSISCVFDSNLSVCTIIAVRNADEMQGETG